MAKNGNTAGKTLDLPALESSHWEAACVIPFTEYEVQMVRFFAQRYSDGEQLVNMTELPRYEEVGKDGVYHIRKRFTDYGLLRGYSFEDVEVLPAVLEVIRQWDNPRVPDYRDKVTKWFWSKPWSIIVYTLVVGIPALLGWLVVLKTILEWRASNTDIP